MNYQELKDWRNRLAGPARKPRPTNHRWNRPAKTQAKHDHKICNTCGEEKPKTEFYRNIGTADGRQNHCKACQKQKNAETQQRKRGKRHVHSKTY